MGKRQIHFRRPEHSGKPKVRLQIASDLGPSAIGIVSVARPHIASIVSQFADGTEMVARVVATARCWAAFDLHPLRKEPFRHHAGGIAFFANLAAAPDKPPERDFSTVHQLSNRHPPTQAVVGELGPLGFYVDGHETVQRIPFVGPQDSGRGRGADLIQGIVNGGVVRRAHLLGQTIVMCGGEFGRTPKMNIADGRDHWPTGFSTFLAGGPFRAGHVHGNTTNELIEIGKDPLKGVLAPVRIEDLHATLLYAFGIDFLQELVTPIGRPLKLSDGKLVKSLLG